MFKYLDQIFVTHGIPEENITDTGKIAWGEQGQRPLLTSKTEKRPFKLGYVKKTLIFGLRTSSSPENRQLSH